MILDRTDYRLLSTHDYGQAAIDLLVNDHVNNFLKLVNGFRF